jgi:hypothetical protein
MNLTAAEKHQNEGREEDVKHAKEHLEDAEKHTKQARGAADKTARKYLDLSETVEQTKEKQTAKEVDVQVDLLKLAHLRHQKRLILGDGGGPAATDGPRKLEALRKLDERIAEIEKEKRKAEAKRSKIGAKVHKQEAERDDIHLSAAEQGQVDTYKTAKQDEHGKGLKLATAAQQVAKSGDSRIAELADFAEKQAEVKLRTQGEGVAGSLYRTEIKKEKKGEGSYGGSVTLNVYKKPDVEWKAKYEEKDEFAKKDDKTDGKTDDKTDGKKDDKKDDKTDGKKDDKKDDKTDGKKTGDPAPTTDAVAAEPEKAEEPEDPPELKTDIPDDLKKVLDAIHELEENEEKDKHLSTIERAKLAHQKEQLEELIVARTGIHAAEADLFKWDWNAKQFRTYLDCRVAHLEAQLDLLRVAIEGKAYAQADKKNLGVAAGLEIEGEATLIGAKVAVHSTPLEFSAFGERFVVGATAAVDAMIGAKLEAAGKGAIALGHHGAGPTAAAAAEAEAFAGAEAEVAAALTFDWNRKQRRAYAEDLGKRWVPFLTAMGLQDADKTGVTTAPDGAVDEILGDMGWGESGDVLVTSVEARAKGQAGAGVEAAARAGFFGGVAQVKASFGFTLGVGFGADAVFRVGVLDGARLLAILAARGAKHLAEGMSFFASWVSGTALPAIKGWATKGKKEFSDLRKSVARVLGISKDEVTDDAPAAHNTGDHTVGEVLGDQ